MKTKILIFLLVLLVSACAPSLYDSYPSDADIERLAIENRDSFDAYLDSKYGEDRGVIEDDPIDRIDEIAEDAGWTSGSTSGSSSSSSGGCPNGCTYYKLVCDIKCNILIDTGEKIYHVPGQEYYEDTKISPDYGERWFCTEAEAKDNGWRKSKQ